MASTIISLIVIFVSLLPSEVGCIVCIIVCRHSVAIFICLGFSTCSQSKRLLISGVARVFCNTYIVEMLVTGQGTEVIHNVVNTEVIAVNGFVDILITFVEDIIILSFLFFICCFLHWHGTFGLIRGNNRVLLVERHLTDTVNGIVGMIHDFWYTVLSTLHHHTRTKHTAEVSTLDGVHRTTGIDGTNTVLLPIIMIRYSITITIKLCHRNSIINKWSTIIIGKQRQEVVSIHYRRLSLTIISTLGIICSFLISTIFDTNISQLIVSSLTIVKFVVVFDRYFTVT